MHGAHLLTADSSCPPVQATRRLTPAGSAGGGSGAREPFGDSRGQVRVGGGQCKGAPSTSKPASKSERRQACRRKELHPFPDPRSNGYSIPLCREREYPLMWDSKSLRRLVPHGDHPSSTLNLSPDLFSVPSISLHVMGAVHYCRRTSTDLLLTCLLLHLISTLHQLHST